MECPLCKGQLVRSTAPFSVNRNGYHISWDAIPAWVCSQCGEPLFEPRETELIQETLRKIDEEKRLFQPSAA
jgi:YgiT-type zinc finger domain-containing protein